MTEEQEKRALELEEEKVKALKKIANSLDALTTWFEEIDKDEWSDRVQYYWAEDHKLKEIIREYIAGKTTPPEKTILTEKVD